MHALKVHKRSLFLPCRYAFAMLLWCLLSGRVSAWLDDSGKLPGMVALSDRVRRGERPECGPALRADVPAAVVTLMQSAWAQKPASRPSAAEAARILAGAISASSKRSSAASRGAPPVTITVQATVATMAVSDVSVSGLSAPATVAASTTIAPPQSAGVVR